MNKPEPMNMAKEIASHLGVTTETGQHVWQLIMAAITYTSAVMTNGDPAITQTLMDKFPDEHKPIIEIVMHVIVQSKKRADTMAHLHSRRN
ncbi:MAG: hypothetical protein OXC91_03315 [Rhodobacteraceae bacterium]|nr:hypothetical protein [Paracoccaceae bacterium]